MIPTRTLSAVCEISTSALVISNQAPAFTGEDSAINVSIQLKNNGTIYTPASGTVAEMYLYWTASSRMTETVSLVISGSTLTGVIPAELTGVAGCPLLVIQLIDTATGALIVAAASPIQIVNVRGDVVISTRPPTPSEIIYVGRAPFVGDNGHWYEWDTTTGAYVDTGIVARGLPATFTATATTLPAGSQATAQITGTATNPVLALGIPKGQDSAVLSVNGKTGAVQIVDEDVPSSAISGAANVKAALGSLSGQIANLQLAEYDAADCAIVFRDGAATYDSSDNSIVINI